MAILGFTLAGFTAPTIQGQDTGCTPTNFCVTADNSAGQGAIIGSQGTTPIINSAFTLTVTGAPPSKFGIFFYGAGRTQVPFGDGVMCVAAPVQRIEPVILTDGQGAGALLLDLTLPPFNGGPFAVTPGSTWNFQFWYRDPSWGSAGFNLSDGLEITYCTDTLPPFTTATPGSGLYPEPQLVTLESNEPATIYYTTDGSLPTVGGTTTNFGPSPITGILIDQPLVLRYLARDASDNEEFPKSSTYDFDFNPPSLSIADPLAGTYGFLEVLDIRFSADEPVTYLVEVGGGGIPGAGAQVAVGFLFTAQLAQVALPCWLLEIAQQFPGNSVWVHVADAAGGVTSHEFLIKTMRDDAIAVGGNTGDLAITPDGALGYLLMPSFGQVWEFDSDVASATFNTILARINVLPNPTSMDLTSDGTRLYITGDLGFSEVDVASHAVLYINMPGGLTPSGIDIHTGIKSGLVGASNGTYWQLDVDPGSPNYRVPSLLPLPSTLLTSAEIKLSPDENQALVTWTSAASYKLQVIDTTPGGSFGTLEIQLVSSRLPAEVGAPVINGSNDTGWATNGSGKINRVHLDFVPPILGLASNSLGVRGMTLSPDESILLSTGASHAGIQIIDPATLQLLRLVSSGGAINGATGSVMRFTPDNKRAYVVRDQGTASSELWMIWLTSQ